MLFELDEAVDAVAAEQAGTGGVEVRVRGAQAILRVARQIDRFTTLRQLLAASRQAALPKPK